RDDRGARASRGERHGLGPHATARLQHEAARRIARVDVQQLRERRGLIDEPRLLVPRVTVHVIAVDHAFPPPCRAVTKTGRCRIASSNTSSTALLVCPCRHHARAAGWTAVLCRVT